MKKIKEIANVKRLIFNQADICILKDNVFLLGKEIIDINKGERISESNKSIYKYVKDELYVLKDNHFIFWDTGFTSGCNIFDNMVISTKVLLKETKTKYHIKSSNFDKIIVLNGFNPIEFFKDKFIFLKNYEKNKIFVVSIMSRKKIWQFILPEGFTIFGKIQILEDVLFFRATKGVNNYKNVYGLNIETGKTLWKQHFQVPYDENNIAFNFSSDNNLCYGYGGNLYQVFDPVKGKILVEKDMSSYYKQGIDPNVNINAVYSDKLWFVGGRGENAKFGALNIKTHEIEFVQDYPLEKDGQFDKPVYHKDKLYLRDSNNVLHIFEKE